MRLLYLVAIFLCLALHTAYGASKEAIYVPEKVSDGTKFCVDSGYSEQSWLHDCVCSNDPSRVREFVDSPSDFQDMHMGVAQRVDGNAAEKKAVREVLDLMNKYWYEEVLANESYAAIRRHWYVLAFFLLIHFFRCSADCA